MSSENPSVIPMIAYRTGPQRLTGWHQPSVSFERARILGLDGSLSHGEMQSGEGIVMLATPSPDYEGPAQHREHCERARAWSTVPHLIDGVLVYIDDVQAHFERAKKAGARILSEPEEGPGRYRVEDLEGHGWYFMER